MQRRWLVLLSLAQRAYSLVPPVKLTDLVVEVDFWTHFSDCFTRDDDPTKGVKERDVLYSAILADAINLGLLQMAQVTPGLSRWLFSITFTQCLRVKNNRSGCRSRDIFDYPPEKVK